MRNRVSGGDGMREGQHQSPPVTVIVDFDGTACEDDLSQVALERFGEEGWERFDIMLEKGDMGLDVALARQFSTIRAPSDEVILEYLGDRCKVRAGLPELVQFCQRKGVPFLVASGGLDFAIRHTLARAGIEGAELICPRTEVGPSGSRVTFPLGIERGDGGDFKEATVLKERGLGRRVLYVGNGLSDFAAVRHANLVFVIGGSPLEVKCQEEGIQAISVQDFWPVLNYLKKSVGR